VTPSADGGDIDESRIEPSDMSAYDADFRDQARRLVDSAENRTSLEVLRAHYSARLHRRSNDFDATFGLRLVTAKLQRISLGPAVVTAAS
jgi:hypothetical protein